MFCRRINASSKGLRETRNEVIEMLHSCVRNNWERPPCVINTESIIPHRYADGNRSIHQNVIFYLL